MSTPEITDVRPAGPARFCEHCGTPLAGGRYCPGCGHALSDDHALSGDGPAAVDSASGAETGRAERVDHAAGEATAAVHVADAAPRAGRRRRGPVAAIVAVVALLAGGGIAALVMSDADASADTRYRQQVASTFGPVLGANQELSDELARLRGTNASDARVAVRQAQQAATIATGALGALRVPAESEQLARDARQVLDREAAYLSAVGAVLADPASASRSQLQTLASNLTSALSAAGPTVAGTAQTVSGADRLTAWAPRARRILKRRADRRKKAVAPTSAIGVASATSTATAPAAVNPYADGRDCGSGVYAGPNTSCGFALNVRDAYYDAPGATASVSAFSPATGREYAMNCAPSGSGVTCSGANDASVAF